MELIICQPAALSSQLHAGDNVTSIHTLWAEMHAGGADLCFFRHPIQPRSENSADTLYLLASYQQRPQALACQHRLRGFIYDITTPPHLPPCQPTSCILGVLLFLLWSTRGTPLDLLDRRDDNGLCAEVNLLPSVARQPSLLSP
jgi:hypothetical protein